MFKEVLTVLFFSVIRMVKNMPDDGAEIFFPSPRTIKEYPVDLIRTRANLSFCILQN